MTAITSFLGVEPRHMLTCGNPSGQNAPACGDVGVDCCSVGALPWNVDTLFAVSCMTCSLKAYLPINVLMLQLHVF